MKNVLFLLFVLILPLNAIAEGKKNPPLDSCLQCRERKSDTCEEECLKVDERKAECIEACIREYCEHRCGAHAMPKEFDPDLSPP